MLLVGGASFGLIAPVLAEASLFSIGAILGSVSPTTNASSGSFNVQNLPLLTSAINTDPSPTSTEQTLAVTDGSALLPQTGPSGTEADIEQKPSSSQISVYTVHAGDTLSSIATMFGVSANTIIWANDIKHGTVHEGETLIILPITGVRHTVKAGDTLASLATSYKSNAQDIAQYNNLADGEQLTSGQDIIIPNGEGISAQVDKKTTKSSVHKILEKTLAQRAESSTKPTAPLHNAGGADLGSYFTWPLNGGVLTQGLHGSNAVDIGAPVGTNVLAAAGGTVIIARNNGGWNGGYGNYIVVQHANGVQTLYSHESNVSVSVGDTVSQGEVIGKVGETGEATGPHVHFEVRGAKNPFGDLQLGQSD